MSVGIALIGALGKMGQEISSLIFADNNYFLSNAVEYSGHPELGKDYGICTGKGQLGISLTSISDTVFKPCTAVIDFSSPKSLRQYLPAAADKGLPVVIGTTGLLQEDIDYAQSFSTRIPVIVSPNMSLGVNLLFLLTELVSNRLKDDFDIEIIEAHHRFKKDSPSGTAKKLGEIAAKSLDIPYDECVKDGRKGIAASGRTRNEIGMHAVRGGDIVGDHTVLFAGIGERIELRHMAHSRSTFARGALFAANWLSDKNPGFYSMRDMLGL